MKKINLKRALFSSLIVYVIGITIFLASFFIDIMSNPEFQANVMLSIAIVPASIAGAWFYYKNLSEGNGFMLGILMFLGAMVLDAIITVPLFIIPSGGNHISFFADPGFWMIAAIYILTVGIYGTVWVPRLKKGTRYRTL